ncbi:ribosome-associated translation inhibitor RaiA [Gottschalkiaceae bacterium SANA]|nr:ribosome-associated translation inhibitor RaiA [Gottschalkiaceae bacterium SANA]
MKIKIVGKNLNVRESLQRRVESKLGKLDRMFNQEVEATATFTKEKDQHIIEVMIPFAGALMRAEASSFDMYDSLDQVVEMLERQVRKHKTKLEKRKHHGASIRFGDIPEYTESEEEEIQIIKHKRFDMKWMNPEEAVLQMDLLGHDFFVFFNSDTEEMAVVYRRKKGGFGIIESTSVQ